MELTMCLSCGEFVHAVKDDGEFVPNTDECPDCGGSEFKHNATEGIVHTNE
jgi:predicted RNA-binding Zn-ribbon protein involved in translation (DUF1610 family)